MSSGNSTSSSVFLVACMRPSATCRRAQSSGRSKISAESSSMIDWTCGIVAAAGRAAAAARFLARAPCAPRRRRPGGAVRCQEVRARSRRARATTRSRRTSACSQEGRVFPAWPRPRRRGARRRRHHPLDGPVVGPFDLDGPCLCGELLGASPCAPGRPSGDRPPQLRLVLRVDGHAEHAQLGDRTDQIDAEPACVAAHGVLAAVPRAPCHGGHQARRAAHPLAAWAEVAVLLLPLAHHAPTSIIGRSSWKRECGRLSGMSGKPIRKMTSAR